MDNMPLIIMDIFSTVMKTNLRVFYSPIIYVTGFKCLYPFQNRPLYCGL